MLLFQLCRWDYFFCVEYRVITTDLSLLIHIIYIHIYLESYPFTTGATSTGVVEVASKSTHYETMSNLHNMIKKQYIHKIEKYYIAIHKIAFFNKNMICIKMFLFLFLFLNVFFLKFIIYILHWYQYQYKYIQNMTIC